MKLKRLTAIAAATVCSVAHSYAQAAAGTASVPVERIPPGNSSPAVPDPNHYPFEELIHKLESDSGAAPQLRSPAQSLTLAETTPSEAPPDYRVSRDVVLPASAQAALNVAKDWMSEKQVPAPGNDGRVLYTYGLGLPTVVCAPMRVCIVELEAGERLSGEPHVGDSVRWMISPAVSGSGRLETPMLVIKPRQAGLDTTLLITTDRRAYYLRLVSKPEDFLARVAFAYPDEDASRWKAQVADQDARRREESERTRISQVASIDGLYFDYRISGKEVAMRPVRVVDDGVKTYIQMPQAIAARELPTLVVMGPKGAEMVNYRVKENTYIVDRLFERAALVLGEGNKAKKVEIIRGKAGVNRPRNAESSEAGRQEASQ